MKSLAETLRQHVAKLQPDWEPSRISSFIYMEGGYSNANYRFEYGGERYVLRTPSVPRPFVDRHLEQRLYDAGSAALMPEIVAFDPDTGHMISRWVAGALLADLAPDPLVLVDYLRELHEAMPDVPRAYDPVAQAQAHLERAEAPDWLASLAASLDWQPETTVPCHNDLNPWNIIHTPEGRWVTLDWEWAGRNDPLFDLVTLHQGASLADEALPGLAGRYLGEVPSHERLQACLVAFWLRETSWAMAEIAAGNDRPEIVEQRQVGLERLAQLPWERSPDRDS